VSEILQAVGRASRRASAVVHEEMGAGLYSLATIASIAPLVGIFGTVLTFSDAFPGIAGQRESVMAYMFEHLSTSMSFTAFGLLVGLLSLWSYRYLTGRLRIFDREMENASLDLLNQLSRCRGRLTFGSVIDRPGPMFGEKPLEELSRDERFKQRCMVLAGTALVLAWFAQASRYFFFGLLPMDAAVRAPWFHTLIIFGISCLGVGCILAHPVWSKLLRRRPGGLVALGSILCLGWSVAELLLGVHLP